MGEVVRDVLQLIPIQEVSSHIPKIMWGTGSLDRITSILGRPISARTITNHRRTPLQLEACIIIDKDFQYPKNIIVEVPNQTRPGNIRRVTLQVEYVISRPLCKKCASFGHWTLVCNEWRGFGDRCQWEEHMGLSEKRVQHVSNACDNQKNQCEKSNATTKAAVVRPWLISKTESE